jgi:hypothetical protein
MKTQKRMIIIVGIFMAFWIPFLLHAQNTKPQEIAEDMRNSLPGQVVKLASWPSAEQQAGKIVLLEASNEFYWAKMFFKFN